MNGWEMLQYHHGSRKWEVHARSYELNAYWNFLDWIQRNHKEMALLPIEYGKAQKQEIDMPDRDSNANREGLDFAQAFKKLLENPHSPDTQALFTVGRRFAQMRGYGDADSAFSYIEGFVSGYAQTANTFIEAPKEREDT